MRPIILFCVASLLHNRCAVAHKWPPKAFCLAAAIPGWRGCGRRVFTRRQPVDRVRPVDVWFQIDVHCVSVRAVTTSAKIFVAVIGVTICSWLGWLVGLWVASESDFGFGTTTTGWVIGLIGGILIAIKWIKPIKAFKRFKRDAKRIKPIKRFKK